MLGESRARGGMRQRGTNWGRQWEFQVPANNQTARLQISFVDRWQSALINHQLFRRSVKQSQRNHQKSKMAACSDQGVFGSPFAYCIAPLKAELRPIKKPRMGLFADQGECLNFKRRQIAALIQEINDPQWLLAAPCPVILAIRVLDPDLALWRCGVIRCAFLRREYVRKRIRILGQNRKNFVFYFALRFLSLCLNLIGDFRLQSRQVGNRKPVQ